METIKRFNVYLSSTEISDLEKYTKETIPCVYIRKKIDKKIRLKIYGKGRDSISGKFHIKIAIIENEKDCEFSSISYIHVHELFGVYSNDKYYNDGNKENILYLIKISKECLTKDKVEIAKNNIQKLNHIKEYKEYVWNETKTLSNKINATIKFEDFNDNISFMFSMYCLLLTPSAIKKENKSYKLFIDKLFFIGIYLSDFQNGYEYGNKNKVIQIINNIKNSNELINLMLGFIFYIKNNDKLINSEDIEQIAYQICFKYFNF